ncbi:hypothetical protein CAEBREN_29515 [Caenorhabditis brenneri]|uniref:Uncharacterized protein n=1 Tax=Caenorhabditis brenneri TaxID=135651 RepID=G0PDU0_CAEBE|nr:hypothetical protein CAEBREN_29515 [Caenorhabditis brenneri]
MSRRKSAKSSAP